VTNGKISIIIPVFNIESYLRRCLESVINQSYKELEIIIINDGSTDSSGVICDEYAKKDTRVKVVHKTNGGLSDAWNVGLSVASGDFIGFVDGDDFVELKMYEKMLGVLNKYQADITVCNHRRLSDSGEINETSGKAYPLTNLEALEIYVNAEEKLKILPTVWSKLFRREIIEGLSFTAGKTSQDVMFTTKAFLRACRIVYQDEYLYVYNDERADSITNKKKGKKRLDVEIPVWKEQISFLESEGYAGIADKASYHFYRKILYYYIDFKLEKEKEAARLAVQIAKGEILQIKAIYQNTWIKIGDKARMKTFLFWPSLYYLLVRLDERTFIPVRRMIYNAKKSL